MRQLDLQFETKAKNAALDLLEEHRSPLINVAREVAFTIAREAGRVTSTEVFKRLRELGYEKDIQSVDPRWIGAVFGRNRAWERIGFESTGSHRRPVSVWKLKSA